MGYMAMMLEFSERLKTARAEAQAQLGQQYGEMIQPVKDAIVRDMAASGMTPLDSTFKLAKKVIDSGNDPLLHLAAGMELVMSGGAA